MQRERERRLILLVQDVFVVFVLCCVVVGFATGKLYSGRATEALIHKTVIDAYKELS